MWMAIVVVCGNMYANSCIAITSVGQYYNTKEECFIASRQKATSVTDTPKVFYALPMCQEIILSQDI